MPNQLPFFVGFVNMREDMARVLCEEPCKGAQRELSKEGLENSPVKEHENLRRNWTSRYYNYKEFGDHIQPLRRYLISCVGRKKIVKRYIRIDGVTDRVYAKNDKGIWCSMCSCIGKFKVMTIA